MARFQSRTVNSDQCPWVNVESGERRGEPVIVGASRHWRYAPRPEFDTRANPVLVMFRRIDSARLCSTLAETAVLVLADLDGHASAADPDDAYADATPAHIDHARKVLQRLAAWVPSPGPPCT